MRFQLDGDRPAASKFWLRQSGKEGGRPERDVDAAEMRSFGESEVRCGPGRDSLSLSARVSRAGVVTACVTIGQDHTALLPRFRQALIHSGGHANRQARPTSKSRFAPDPLARAWTSWGVGGPDDDQRGWTSRHAWSHPRFRRGPTRFNRRWDRRAVRRNRGTRRACWSLGQS